MKKVKKRKMFPWELMSLEKLGLAYYPITYKDKKYYVEIRIDPHVNKMTGNSRFYSAECRIYKCHPKDIMCRGKRLCCMDITHLRGSNGETLNLDPYCADDSLWDLPDLMAAIFKMYEYKMEEQEKERAKTEWDGVVRF